MNYNNVKQLFSIKKGIAFTRKKSEENEDWADNISLLKGGVVEQEINEQVYYCYPFKEGFIYQTKVGDIIKYSDFLIKKEITDKKFYFHTYNQNLNNKIIISSKEPNGKKYYFLSTDLILRKVPFLLNMEIGGVLLKSTIFNKEVIFAFDNVYYNNIWQTDISSYGKYINLRDEQQPNEIDGDLMGYESLLFVPLRGGQLLALDVDTGEKVWMLEQDISGQYAIFQDKIYKKNRFLYEIDARTGKIIRQKDIEDGSIPDSFMAIGPIWVYDDVIILINNYEGDIVILNGDNFSVYDKINIGTAMAHSKDIIIWHDNKLYVLDLANTLHIYEKD